MKTIEKETIVTFTEILIMINEIIELKNSIDTKINELDLIKDSDLIQCYGSISGQLTKILKL